VQLPGYVADVCFVFRYKSTILAQFVALYTLSGMIRNNKHNYIGWQYLATALLGMLQ
jgi:hypothetical protein